jgi:hypothetical protein
VERGLTRSKKTLKTKINTRRKVVRKECISIFNAVNSRTCFNEKCQKSYCRYNREFSSQ